MPFWTTVSPQVCPVLSCIVPPPSLRRPLPPVSVTLLPTVKSPLFTVTEGRLMPLTSVREVAAGALIVQPEEPTVSPNSNEPMVRSESSVTTRLAVMSIVLKSAKFPAPSATMPPDQLPMPLQTPSALLVHVPFWAWAQRLRQPTAAAARQVRR